MMWQIKLQRAFCLLADPRPGVNVGADRRGDAHRIEQMGPFLTAVVHERMVLCPSAADDSLSAENSNRLMVPECRCA